MRHIKLFLATATLLAGSVSMLRAESVMALNSADVSMPAVGSSPITAPPGDTTTSVGPLPPVVEIAARDEVKDQPEVLTANLSPSASHLGLLPVRPSAHHRVRARSSCAHHYRPARVVKRTGQVHSAALRPSLWRGVHPAGISAAIVGQSCFSA
jgi:hypothetical protein